MFEDIDLKVGESKSGAAPTSYTETCSTYTKEYITCGHTSSCTTDCCTCFC